MPIKAANVTELHAAKDWIVVDLGFSNRRKSCGMLIENNASLLTFAEVKDELAKICEKRHSRPLYLMLEAPLSVAFDVQGNPVGRRFEKPD